MNKNSTPVGMGLSVPWRLEDCKTPWEVMMVIDQLFYHYPPEEILQTFMRPDDIEKLLHRPGLKPYFKTGRFAARHQLTKILWMVFNSRDHNGREDYRTFSPIIKMKAYRKFKSQFTPQHRYKKDETKLPYAKLLVRRGFTVKMIVRCLEVHYATPITKDPTSSRLHELRWRFIHRHKGKKPS